MKVVTIVGARPQFIKAGPLSSALAKAGHEEFMIHTGQHYDEAMSGVFFKQLGIREPDLNLGAGSGSHAEQTARMLVPLECHMQEQKPDWVVVYGDTNSTLAGALGAAKIQLPVAHVEAGLRSFNRTMPEEINRVLTDHVSTLLLCPTPTAVENLAVEGITRGVVLTGDIMVDALLANLKMAQTASNIHDKLGINPNEMYGAATIHRAGNTDSRDALAAILTALGQLEFPVIFTVHPRTSAAIERYGLTVAPNVRQVAPLDYLDMLALVSRAKVVITDSGGLQKEAYVLKVPCVTVRPDSEWMETVSSGWNRLVEPDAIGQGVAQALGEHPNSHPDFYGTGQAASEIVAALEAGV